MSDLVLLGLFRWIQNAFITAPETGLATTIGRFAFEDAESTRSARVIEKVSDIIPEIGEQQRKVV
jgi:hypothetical protein